MTRKVVFTEKDGGFSSEYGRLTNIYKHVFFDIEPILDDDHKVLTDRSHDSHYEILRCHVANVPHGLALYEDLMAQKIELQAKLRMTEGYLREVMTALGEQLRWTGNAVSGNYFIEFDDDARIKIKKADAVLNP